ncbi:hypothetical protein CcCBS67573_g05784 [Chytriomyces confervae]|uniref:Heme haloperoxidase family profile domain-containing protein n=1 Tax=Chytriomyces confervae TaxID=246404 RepID=A0A507F8C6_9FUNG|nr:hypothetical protein HDU80_004982 [Chytriomyces hyalinus]TPX72539.1 hypothetical protein CcCBS67573_g05784 [Chytriomyces confervae]
MRAAPLLLLFACLVSAYFPGSPGAPSTFGQEEKPKPAPVPFQRMPWVAAKKGESRSQCPMLNAMANHGYIAHSGRDIGMGSIVLVLEQMKFPSLMAFIFPMFQGFWMPKTDLMNHHLENFNVWDHDASLTRHDRAISNSTKADKRLVEQLLSFAGDKTYLTTFDLARARRLRYAQSKSANPNFKFGPVERFFAIYECLKLMNVIGKNGKLPVDVTRDFFINERLPQKWKEHEWDVGLFGLLIYRDFVTFTVQTYIAGDVDPSATKAAKDEL